MACAGAVASTFAGAIRAAAPLPGTPLGILLLLFSKHSRLQRAVILPTHVSGKPDSREVNFSHKIKIRFERAT